MAQGGFFQQNTNYNADDVRQLTTATFPTTACGVLSPTDLVVTAPTNGGVVTVSAGRAVMSTTSGSATGHRFISSNTAAYNAKNYVGGSTTWTLPASNNYRVDTVFVRVTDKALDAGASADSTDIFFRTGTESASLASVAPTALPSNWQYSILGYVYSYNTGSPVIEVRPSWPGYPGRATLASLGGMSISTTGAMPTAGPIWEGRLWYQTDTDRLLVHSGGATAGWQPPWNLPWGVVSKNSLNSDPSYQGLLTATFADVGALTNMTTFTGIAGRLYRHSIRMPIQYVTGAGATVGLAVQMTDSGGTQQAVWNIEGGMTIGAGFTIWQFDWVAQHTGSTVRKLQWRNDSAPGSSLTIRMASSANNPFQWYVEDIGPNAAPT